MVSLHRRAFLRRARRTGWAVGAGLTTTCTGAREALFLSSPIAVRAPGNVERSAWLLGIGLCAKRKVMFEGLLSRTLAISTPPCFYTGPQGRRNVGMSGCHSGENAGSAAYSLLFNLNSIGSSYHAGAP